MVPVWMCLHASLRTHYVYIHIKHHVVMKVVIVSITPSVMKPVTCFKQFIAKLNN